MPWMDVLAKVDSEPMSRRCWLSRVMIKSQNFIVGVIIKMIKKKFKGVEHYKQNRPNGRMCSRHKKPALNLLGGEEYDVLLHVPINI